MLRWVEKSYLKQFGGSVLDACLLVEISLSCIVYRNLTTANDVVFQHFPGFPAGKNDRVRS